jgi:hypothetical protein
MSDKQQLLTLLRDEFNDWEILLATLHESQITTPTLRPTISIKDEIAHLLVWQQISRARLEAALNGGEPQLTGWSVTIAQAEEDSDPINAWAYETYREEPWLRVYQEWKAGFLGLLELGEAVPETDLLEIGKYPWLEGYALSAVLSGSYEHHQEHLDFLLEWLRHSND